MAYRWPIWVPPRCLQLHDPVPPSPLFPFLRPISLVFPRGMSSILYKTSCVFRVFISASRGMDVAFPYLVAFNLR